MVTKKKSVRGDRYPSRWGGGSREETSDLRHMTRELVHRLRLSLSLSLSLSLYSLSSNINGYMDLSRDELVLSRGTGRRKGDRLIDKARLIGKINKALENASASRKVLMASYILTRDPSNLSTSIQL